MTLSVPVAVADPEPTEDVALLLGTVVVSDKEPLRVELIGVAVADVLAKVVGADGAMFVITTPVVVKIVRPESFSRPAVTLRPSHQKNAEDIGKIDDVISLRLTLATYVQVPVIKLDVMSHSIVCEAVPPISVLAAVEGPLIMTLVYIVSGEHGPERHIFVWVAKYVTASESAATTEARSGPLPKCTSTSIVLLWLTVKLM